MLPVQNAVAVRRVPVVTWVLIATNCAIFLFEVSLGPAELEWFLWRFGLVPDRDLGSGGAALPFFSNMFLHGGWLHLLLNMWTLWLFGPVVEDRLGSGRYIGFYFTCGFVASLTHALSAPASDIPALGASGAIAGVIGCHMRLYPFARLVVLVPILFIPLFFEVPALVFALLWFATQLMQGMLELFIPSTTGGVAWWAHIGGFVIGFVLAPLLRQPARRHRSYYADEGFLGFEPTGRR